MQKLTRRQCKSQKECSECGIEIAMGSFYYGNPNQSLCESCKIKLENLEKSSKEAISQVPDIEKPGSYGYIVKDACKYCGEDTKNTLILGIPTCMKDIDKALAESI